MINKIMLDLSKEIIELNQVEQLAEGIDAQGQQIKTLVAEEQGLGNVYSSYTIIERKAVGLQTDKVDLKFSGVFWKTFKVKKIKDGFEVTANYNVHGEDIRENFNVNFDFLGLTDDNLEYFALNEVFPKLEKRIKTLLGL